MLRHALRFLTVLSVFVFCGSLYATINDTSDSAVGGVLINAEGMLSQVLTEELTQLRTEVQENLDPIAGELDKPVKYRRVSLKKINEEVAYCTERGLEIPDAVKCLGGLTEIRYLLIFPEEQDVVLVGRAEGWEVGPKGVLVGKESGKPVLQLEDLAAAMHAASGDVRKVFSVSIDPTKEGLQRMSQYASTVNAQQSPKAIAAGMEKALGAQSVTFQGVDPASHFAYVLAAADFRMKQISMGVTKSPVRTLPSFVSMMKSPSENGALPRWWLAPNYDSISCDAERLTWSFSGGKVVTMTETDLYDGNAIVRQGGKENSVFKKWADKMTENYAELSVKEPIFGQLKNCMDCALAAAVLAENGTMDSMASTFAPMLASPELNDAREYIPTQVPSASVVARKGGAFMFVTGGVAINPWEMVQNSKKADLGKARAKLTIPAKSWFEN